MAESTEQMEHWEEVHSRNSVENQAWYEPHSTTALEWIRGIGLAFDAPILDVGGGASNLVDDLLAAGHTSITVLDISRAALEQAKARLGAQSALVQWLHGDITHMELPAASFDLWHDRATFHFLTAAAKQQAYRAQVLRALRPGGHLIIATFAEDGPSMCSGLPVQRYSIEQLQQTLGESFQLQAHKKESHFTPGGSQQMFLCCHFRRAS